MVNGATIIQKRNGNNTFQNIGEYCFRYYCTYIGNECTKCLISQIIAK